MSLNTDFNRFRWAALQLAALEQCASPYEIMEQLEELPKDLYATYQQMLEAIDSKFINDTIIFLQFLAFSMQPMKVVEIAEAITIDYNCENGPIFNPNKRYANPKHMLTRCSSLVSESNGKYICLSYV